MRIAIIMGRGIEGAGVTRRAVETNNWLNNNGYKSNIFVLMDKKWPRKSCQEVEKYIPIDTNNIRNFTKILNKFDYIFYSSIPAKRGFSEKCVNDFYNYLVKDIDSPKKIGVQSDHKGASLSRNANLYEIFSEMDFIASHSINSIFYKKLVEMFGDKIKKRFVQLERGVDLDYFEKEFRNNNYKERRKGVIQLGRFATFKDPYRIIKFHNEFLRQKKFFTELVGIERSLASFDKIFDFPGENGKRKSRHLIEIHDCSYPNRDYFVPREKQKDNTFPYVYGIFDRDETLKQITNNLFGCSFYNIQEITDISTIDIEFAQIEMIASGLIPLFDFDWGNRNSFEGEKIRKIPYLGIFLKKDLSNAEKCADKMNEIYKNKELRKKYLDTSYDLIKMNNDSNIVFKKFFTKVGL